MAIQVYLIRHGEVERDLTNLIGGSDPPLTDRGKTQMRELALALKGTGIRVDEFWSSTLIRARESTGELCQWLPYDPSLIRYDDRLMELQAGDWEGLPKATVLTTEVQEQMTRQGMDFRYPQGDSMTDVADRIIEGWMAERLREWEHLENREVLVSLHGNAIRSSLARLFGVDKLKAWLLPAGDDASVTKLVYTDSLWRLAYANRTAHVTF